jgi:hypothetical protein
MGATTVLIMSEKHLEYLKYIHIIDILIKYGIICYLKNVNDILIVYSFIHTSAEEILGELNKFSPNLDFTLEKEKNITLNVLDITINRYNHSQSGSLESLYLETLQLQTLLFLAIRVIQ